MILSLDDDVGPNNAVESLLINLIHEIGRGNDRLVFYVQHDYQLTCRYQ